MKNHFLCYCSTNSKLSEPIFCSLLFLYKIHIFGASFVKFMGAQHIRFGLVWFVLKFGGQWLQIKNNYWWMMNDDDYTQLIHDFACNITADRRLSICVVVHFFLLLSHRVHKVLSIGMIGMKIAFPLISLRSEWRQREKKNAVRLSTWHLTNQLNQFGYAINHLKCKHRPVLTMLNVENCIWRNVTCLWAAKV